jgi:hypothetical protein
MKTLVSKDVKKSLERNRIASLHLINMLPSSIRDHWRDKLFGSPTDKIVEIVMAHLMNGIATDSNGYDIESKEKKYEVKFAFISNILNKKGYPRREAKIANLKSKDCDLLVVCIDPDIPNSHNDYMRILHLPVEVWKEYWKSDAHSLSFGSQSKWYKNYRI